MKIKNEKFLNLFFRLGAFGSKFLLTIFLAKSLSVRDFGFYGFVVAVVAVAPAIFGLGINYTVCRLVPNMSPSEGASLLAKRIVVSNAMALFFSFLFYAYSCFFDLNEWGGVYLAALFYFEIVAFDAHYGLISLGKSVLANFLLFIRTGAWVIIYIGWVFYFKSEDPFGVMIFCWLFFAFFAVIFYFVYLASLGAVIGKDVFSWAKSIVVCNKKVYFSDILISSTANLDRFAVGLILGLEFLGIYSFFVMFSNAIQSLISNSFVQVEVSKLVRVFADKGKFGLKCGVELLLRSVINVAWVMSVLVLIGVYVCLIFMEKKYYLDFFPGLLILIAAHNTKLFSEVFNYGLYIMGRDFELVMSNVVGVLMTFIPVVVGAVFFGLYGVFLGVLFGALVVFAYRKAKYEFNISEPMSEIS